MRLDRCDLKIRRKALDTNPHRLIRLVALARCLTAKSTRIVERFASADFEGDEVIHGAAELAAQNVLISAAGLENLTRLKARRKHVTITLPAPGARLDARAILSDR